MTSPVAPDLGAGPTGTEVVTVTANPALDHTVWVDGFRIGEVNRVRSEHRAPGGKGINVAVALACQGHRPVATGFLGADDPAPFEAFLAQRGIPHFFVAVAGTTRTGVKVVDDPGGTTTDLNFPGFEVTGDDVAALEAAVGELSAPDRWVVLAGSLPVGAPPGLYRRLAEVAHGSGARVALDTSGPALAAAMGAPPDLAKPNWAELEELTGRTLGSTAEVAAAARRLAEGGIGTVIVSLGAEGAVFVRDGQAVAAAPPPVRVASTVGAGDAMVAGALAATLDGLALADLAALATAFGAVAVATIGSILDPAAVAATVPHVRVEQLP